MLEALESCKDVGSGEFDSQCAAVLYNFSLHEKSVTHMVDLGAIFIAKYLFNSNVLKVNGQWSMVNGQWLIISHEFCGWLRKFPSYMTRFLVKDSKSIKRYEESGNLTMCVGYCLFVDTNLPSGRSSVDR